MIRVHETLTVRSGDVVAMRGRKVNAVMGEERGTAS